MSQPHLEQNKNTLNGFPAEAYEHLYEMAFPEGDGPRSPMLGETDEVEIAPDLATLLADPSVIVASLEDDGELIGFSLAMPIDKMDPSRASETAETAYIYDTIITPDRQGQGLVGSLSDALFRKLQAQGFSYIEEDCMISNGYADKVQKTYGPAIVESYDHTKWPENGPQRFFRIDLDLVPKIESPAQ